MNKSLVSSVAVLLISQSAFAVCEHELKEYNAAKDLCEKLEAATHVTGVAGGILGSIFAIPTFGLSVAAGGLAAAGPALAAQNACRIKEEKKNNLQSCQKSALKRELAEKARVEAEVNRQSQRLQQIEEINQRHQNSVTQVERERDQAFEQALDAIVNTGADLEAPETQELIERTRVDIFNRFSEVLERLEQERAHALSQV